MIDDPIHQEAHDRNARMYFILDIDNKKTIPYYRSYGKSITECTIDEWVDVLEKLNPSGEIEWLINGKKISNIVDWHKIDTNHD